MSPEWIVAIVVFAALAGLYLFAVLVSLLSIVIPNPVRQLQHHGPPEKWGLSPERVVVGDGSAAWFFPRPGRTAVLICHGRSRSKAWMLPLISRLAPERAVLAIDFPSHGENRYGTTTVGPRESETVSAALDWLDRAGHEAVLVYGVSMGGAAAIIALGERPHGGVVGLVTDGAFDELSRVFDNIARRLPIPPHFRRLVFALARWTVGSDPERVRPILVAPELSMPALFIHGERDPLVPPDAALNLANATGNNGRYMLYDGYHDESDNPAMHALVCDFFDEVDPVAPVTTSAAD